MADTGNPYPLFNGLNGLALDLGYIYVGLENQDPETNPIATYWDAALTQLASQPIRTIGGYADRSGSPARFFTGAKHSVRVKDSQGNLVFYEPSAGDAVINAGDPYFVHAQYLGDPPGVSAVVCKHVFGINVSFPTDMASVSWAHFDTPPSGSSTVFDMRYDGVSFGSLTVATNGAITVSCTALSAVKGHYLSLHSPALATAAANFAITLKGTVS